MTGPNLTFTEDNVVIVGTTETAMMTHICRGVKAGEPVILMGGFYFQEGTDGTVMALQIRETDGVGGTAVSEAVAVDGLVSTSQRVISQMVVAIAYQDDPIYVMTAEQTAATANGTFFNGWLGHIPMGKGS